MKETTRRTLRGLIQFLGGVPVTALAVWLFGLEENAPAVLAIQGVLQALVAALQNALEDAGVDSRLVSPVPRGTDPPEEGGAPLPEDMP